MEPVNGISCHLWDTFLTATDTSYERAVIAGPRVSKTQGLCDHKEPIFGMSLEFSFPTKDPRFQPWAGRLDPWGEGCVEPRARGGGGPHSEIFIQMYRWGLGTNTPNSPLILGA